jgi:drug/metabolite transporter (DMT)-like permease
MNTQGFLFVLAAAFMWGLIGVFTNYILPEGVSALEIAFWRATFAWVLFVIHAGVKKQIKVQKTDLPALFGFGFICVTLFYGSYQLAIRDVGMALAAVLLYTAPAWVALMSWLVLNEQMTKTKITCVIATIIGVACISLGPQLMSNNPLEISWFGIAAGLVAGFTYALYYIFGKKFLYRYPTPTIFVYALPFGAAMLFPFVDFAPKSAYVWMLLIGLGAVTSYGAFSAYYTGLKRMEATQASVVATFEPVVAAIFAFILFGETFSILGYVGSSMIIAAVLFVVFTGARPSRATTEDTE